jgi:hypothetical protein
LNAIQHPDIAMRTHKVTHQVHHIVPEIVTCSYLMPLFLPSRNPYVLIQKCQLMPKQKSIDASSQQLIPVETNAGKIFLIRGQKVMLDRDLAQLYGVSTRGLNEQSRRNRDRFPEDFAFVLTLEEFANLKSHFATSSSVWGGRRKLPYAFSEHGAIMAANVLSSPIAVRASIQVVRASGVRAGAILAGRAGVSP